MNDNNEVKKICEELIRADTEQQVITILTEAGYWDDPEVWRYYGDNENNYSSFGNQQSRSDYALVEKLVNSIDAMLMGECLVRGIDPEGDNAPCSIREAVAEFFEENPSGSTAGQIREWSPGKRAEVAKGITLAATGSRSLPSFTIADLGEGQTPDKMPDTLLSLSKSNKLRIPFVQGKFNMGGTGALKFCGRHNLQLIISRRNPKILPEKIENPSDLKWGFTVVRREPPTGRLRNSVYRYLAPLKTSQLGNGVLRFASKSMQLFPEANKPYLRAAQWGTLIKLYEYNAAGFRSHILLSPGMLGRMDLLLPGVALPVRFHECRDYRGNEGSFDTTMTGLRVRLEEKKGGNLEDGFPHSSSMNVLGEKMTLSIYAFKSGTAKVYRKDEGILFVVNGQTHAHFSTNFFKQNKVGLSHIAGSLLVIVDCTELSPLAIENLIMNSRDRLSGGELKSAIESELEDILKQNQALRDLRERRRREEMHSKLEDSKPLEDVLKSLLKKNPTLSKIFLEGNRISTPFRTIGVVSEQRVFTGARYPTYFKFKGKEYGTVLKREAHINMKARIAFETDAENEYFSRYKDRGKSAVYMVEDGKEVPFETYTLNLQNGIATLNLQLPFQSKVGQELQLSLSVTDRTQIEPFRNSFTIKILAIVEPKEGKSKSRRNPPSKEKGVEREVPGGIQLPNIERVYENPKEGDFGWNSDIFDPPFDKYSALRVMYAGNGSQNGDPIGTGSYDFYINVDNIFLRNEVKNTKAEPELIIARFLYGMTLIGIALLHDDLEKRKNRPNNSSDADDVGVPNIEDKIEDFSKAIAPVLNPMIENLGDLDLGEEILGNTAGEDA